jgi:ATP-dependent helicase/nuclease subunit A
MTEGARVLARLDADDARARRLARQVFDRPLVLEAGAGTGKTTALVTRVLAWSFGPGWQRAADALAAQAPPERIAARVLGRVVAITFTEAAAAEMGVRTAEALLAVESGARPVWLEPDALPSDTEACRMRARALRGALDHLVVQTIHAWCRRLLAAHPLDARVHPFLEVDADGRVQAEVVREVLDASLAAAYSLEDSAALRLAGLGVGPPELELELLALLGEGVRARDLAADPFTPTRLAALRGRALRACRGLLAAGGDALRAARRSPTTQRTLARVDATVDALRGDPWPDAEALGRFRERLHPEWERAELVRLRAWARGELGVTEQALVGQRRRELALAAASLLAIVDHLLRLEPRRLGLARDVLAGLLAEVEERLRGRGVVGFASLLSGAGDLLRERPDVARRVRAGIDQLLVDEFQDTDATQCDILRALVLFCPPDERPGLFVVGDPKQSIYGWRSADLAAYDAFVRDVESSGGRRARLCVNHRSVPAVLEEVERVVEPIMEREEGVQPPFEPLAPAPARRESPGFRRARFAPAEYWVSAEWDAEAGAPAPTRSGDASELEARALARELRELHEQHGVAWKDVGVLFRGRGDLEVYLAALRDGGVPFAVAGDRCYYRRREIVEAAALVRCVVDPNDQLALVTVLRSPLGGVPDAALVPLWSRRFPALAGALEGPATGALAELRRVVDEAAAALPADVPGLERVAGWDANLVHLLEVLALLRRSYREDPPDRFVERMRSLTLLEATEAARHLGAWRVANLERFFHELEAELAGAADPFAFLRALRRAVRGEEGREEGRPEEAADDAVRVLTIHGAKGLAFEHVYVMQLHKGAGAEARQAVLAREKDGVLEYRLVGAPTPGFDRVARDRETVAAAEQVRALYVAMTRARERLVLAGLWPVHQRGRRPGGVVELLARRRAGSPDLDATMGLVAAQGGAPIADACGARWVFPALAAEAAPRRRRRRGQVGALPTAERVAPSGDDRIPAVARRPSGDDRIPAVARRPSGDDRIARAVGTAIHRVLEEMDLGAGVQAELTRAELLEAAVRSTADTALAEAVLARARALLARIARGSLAAELERLAPGIVARELPFLGPPAQAAGPVGVVAGVIDLVYRDPESAELVIADYKTDSPASAGEIALRASAYAEQGDVYQRALRGALGLAYQPRFELWFLAADRIIVPHTSEAGPPRGVRAP